MPGVSGVGGAGAVRHALCGMRDMSGKGARTLPGADAPYYEWSTVEVLLEEGNTAAKGTQQLAKAPKA